MAATEGTQISRIDSSWLSNVAGIFDEGGAHDRILSYLKDEGFTNISAWGGMPPRQNGLDVSDKNRLKPGEYRSIRNSIEPAAHRHDRNTGTEPMDVDDRKSERLLLAEAQARTAELKLKQMTMRMQMRDKELAQMNVAGHRDRDVPTPVTIDKDATFKIDTKAYPLKALFDGGENWKETLKKMSGKEYFDYKLRGVRGSIIDSEWSVIKADVRSRIEESRDIVFYSSPIRPLRSTVSDVNCLVGSRDADEFAAAMAKTGTGRRDVLHRSNRILEVKLEALLARCGIEEKDTPEPFVRAVQHCCEAKIEEEQQNRWAQLCRKLAVLIANATRYEDAVTVNLERDDDDDTKGYDTHTQPNAQNSRPDLTFKRLIGNIRRVICCLELKTLGTKQPAADVAFQVGRYSNDIAGDGLGRSHGLTILIEGFRWQLCLTRDRTPFEFWFTDECSDVNKLATTLWSILSATDEQCGVFTAPDGYVFLPGVLGCGGECTVFAVQKIGTGEEQKKKTTYVVKFWRKQEDYDHSKKIFEEFGEEFEYRYDDIGSHGLDIPIGGAEAMNDDRRYAIFSLHAERHPTCGTLWDWQMLGARLSKLHDEDVMYVDITPANIMYNEYLQMFVLTDVGSVVSKSCELRDHGLRVTPQIFPKAYYKENGLDKGCDQISLFRSMQMLKLRRRRQQREKWVESSCIDAPLSTKDFIARIADVFGEIRDLVEHENDSYRHVSTWHTHPSHAYLSASRCVGNIPTSEATEATRATASQDGQTKKRTRDKRKETDDEPAKKRRRKEDKTDTDEGMDVDEQPDICA